MTAADPIVVEVGSAPITVTVASTGLVLSVATGTVGPAGPKGDAGTNGTNGQGVPTGGTTGQVLAKKTGTNYDTEWVDQTGGGGGSGTVTSVTGTAPISVATGTTTPVVSIAAATTSAAGSMSASDKSKLDGVATGATANSPDATLLARANHTGTQALSTISDAGTAAAKNAPATGNASATEVVLGSDTRLTDARTPSSTLSHASTHAAAGSDPVTLAASQIGSGTFDAARLPAATTSAQGAMSSTDKSKLDGIAAGATANSSDATLLNRANHTGTQAVGTITGLAAVATSGSASDLTTGTVATGRLGTGTASSSTFLRGDGTWSTATDAGAAQKASNLSDLASASSARTNLGLGSLATLSTITSSEITDGTIVNGDISASAAISTSKISGLAAVATSGSGSDITTGTVAVARLGSTAPPTPTPYASNDWVPLWSGLGGGASTTTVGGTAVSSNNAVRYQPVWIGQTVSLIGLGVDVAAANAGASAVVRLGLYSDSSGRPGSVVVDAGTASLGTAVAKELTFSSVSLSPGWYWVALATQSLDTSGTNPGFRAVQNSASLASRTSVPSATATQDAVFTSSSVTGAFGNNPTVTIGTLSLALKIWGKFA